MASWLQRTVVLPGRKRGCHLITDEVLRELPELRSFRVGLLHVFIQHTSASLSLNENADPSVRADMETVLNRLVPESAHYVHDDEGPDDMPAHAKASLMGASGTLPISDGRPALGTWQGIYLCEHRNAGGPRRLVLTVNGERR
jgi:secondary thiamine-phosphate synthase enzyme